MHEVLAGLPDQTRSLAAFKCFVLGCRFLVWLRGYLRPEGVQMTFLWVCVLSCVFFWFPDSVEAKDLRLPCCGMRSSRRVYTIYVCQGRCKWRAYENSASCTSV